MALLAAAICVIALVVFFPLSAVGQMTSLAFLLVYAAVSLGHLKLRAHTGARRGLLIGAIVANAVLFTLLLIEAVRTGAGQHLDHPDPRVRGQLWLRVAAPSPEVDKRKTVSLVSCWAPSATQGRFARGRGGRRTERASPTAWIRGRSRQATNSARPTRRPRPWNTPGKYGVPGTGGTAHADQ